MRVDFGNDKAIEGYRDPEAEDPDEILYRPLPGQRVTTLVFPDEIEVAEAFATTVATMKLHIEEGEIPVWVECDDERLGILLTDYYEIEETRDDDWGSEV